VGSFTIDVVVLPASAQMITDTANENDCGNDCPVKPLADYIAQNGAYAGINGTYFCPSDYADCAGKINSYDFPVYNSRLGKWLNASSLFWNGRSMMLKNGGMQFLRNANSYGGGGTAGIVNHPGVLENGNVIANDMGPNGSQQSKGTRGGIGFNSSNIFLVIARNASVQDLGYIFKALGATSALNLDGGGSVALWYGGYKVGPGRALPNAIVFK
jgi:exopolysaccharide biosynthesis protein